MAKKKKDEIVATIGLDGKIVKNNDKQNKNIVADVDYEGNIRPYAPAPSVNNNRNSSFVSSLMNTQNDVFSKVMTFQNQQPSILEEDNSLDTFIDTGKKYGDYFYFDYENKKDNKIYKKGNNYYLFDDKTNSYVDVNQATNRFTDKKSEKEELEKAKQLGYKEQERRTSKEYDKANSVFKKLQKQYKLSDKELQNFIDNGDLSQKHVSLVTNSMRNTTREAVKYRNDIKEGKIKQYDDTVLSINDRLDLDTANLTNKKYNEYEEDLLRQQEAKDNQKDRINYGYDGTLSGTLKALNSTKNKVNDKIDKEVIYPIKHAKENYELGKKNNQLALEYYKKMEGKKNNAEELAQEMDKYQYFNKDLINNPGWAGTAIQNANTQVESLKKQGIGATVLGTIGSVIGTVINPGAGTVAGLKAGSSIGYTLGSTPYTYKLEAGNQYKTLLDMGVPDKIAKKHSKRVGAINAAIESGENIVDLFTFNSGSGTKAITKQTVSDLVDEYGEKQVNSWLSKKIGDKAANMMVTSAKSYLQNIASESVEEMTQEASSIVGERLAAKESNVDRNVSLKDDLSRVLEAGSSAAISTAFTAPISSVSGSIATNTMNNIQSKIENKIVKSNVINNEIMKEINKSNSDISNEDALNIQRQVYQELDNNGVEIINVQQNTPNLSTEMTVEQQNIDNNINNQFNDNHRKIAPIMRNVDISENNNNVVNNDKINLDDYDSKTERVIKSAERNVIVRSYKQLDGFIDEALDTQSNKALHFGRINETITQRIKRKLENLPRVKAPYLTKEKYDLVMNQSEIRHLIEDKTKMTRDDVHKYVKVLPDIVSKFDSASYSIENDSEGIRFKKKLPDGNYISFVLVSNKQGTLKAKSIHLDKVDYEAKKRSISPTNDVLKTPNRTSETDGAFASLDNNTTTNSQKKQIAPVSQYNMQGNEKNIPITREYQKNTIDEKIKNDDNYLKVDSVRDLDPIQISNIKESDASTTPKLPNVRRNGPFANKESSFYKNSTKKSEFLTENSRDIISKEDDVRFYKGITNDDTLEEAYNKLQRGGKSETMKWFSKESKDATAVDVAQGWILLKHYQDSGDYDSMVEVAKKMREIGTTSGQTVQAFNILARLTPEGMVKYAQSELTEAYNKMVENKTKNWIDKHQQDFDLTSDEVQFIIDTMKDVQNMEDGYDKRVKLAEIQKLMTDKLPTERGRKIKSWMRISMLFNPKTQVRNVMGNAIIAPINYFGDIFASAADKMISKKTGIRTTGIANVKSILKGLKEGAYQATNDYKKGINTRDMEGNRFEIGEGKSFSDKNLIGKNLNRVDGLLNYVMDVGDRVFSQSSFENSLQNQMKLNNTTKITQDMIDIAHSESLQRTWNDNNNYTKFVLGVRRGLNKIGIKGYGLGDVLIPFAKTPANLTKAIVDYSPIGLIQSIGNGINLKRSLTNGQYNSKMQHHFVQNLGKATAGTMLYVIGYALAKAKITTGESDDDKDVASFMKNTLGTNSYSIKIGNKSFTYDWAQPLAAPLSITANIVNKKYKSKDLKEFTETVIDSLDTGGSILLEQSFLQSINDVLKNNDGVVSGLVNEVLELPARAIPTFSKQIADMTDSTQRQTYVKGEPVETALNSAKAKIPFVSKTLTPSVDTMGRNIKKYGGKNNAFNVLFNPANVNNENISSAAKEIYKVYNATDDKTIFPRVAPYSIDKLPLSTKQRADYQKIGGELVEKSINELIKNDDYKDLSNKDKAVVISKIVGYNSAKAKSKVLKTKMSRYWNSVNRYLDKGGTVAEYYLYKVVDD